MSIKQKSVYFLAIIGVFSFFSSVHAVTIPTSLTLKYTSGDAVQVSVSGKESSRIQLSFLPPGAPVLTTIVLGTTDIVGNFSTSISSGGYGIPSGSPVFVTITGMQSAMTLWPVYTSALTLTDTNLHIGVGQSITVGGSAALILAANSQSAGISTSISGSQITLTGISSGSGTVTVCGANVGCGSIAVEVGAGTDQAGITFSPANPVLRTKQSTSVTIFGGGTNGYTIASNSNPDVVDPSFGGERDVLWLFGKAGGKSTLSLCSKQFSTNCADVALTVLNNTVTTLSFTPNNIVLIPGLTQGSTISGGTDGNYYVSSNSNSGVAHVSITGSTVTVSGGSTVGSTVITICSTTVNNSCGGLNVVLNSTSSGNSATTLTFSQNIVSLPQGEMSNVTVTGGTNTGYSISSNSNSNVVTATIHGTSNVINLYGNAIGSAIVSVCSTSANTVCAGLYVTVSSALTTITLNQHDVTLNPGEKKLISIAGGDAHTVVYSNSNPAVVTTFLSADGSGVVLTGGTTSGTADISICPTNSYSSKCSTVSVTVHVPTVPVLAPATKPVTIVSKPSTVVSSSKKVKIVGTPVLRVRQSSNTKSVVIDGVKKDEIFDVLKEEGGWYKIKTTRGITGWISGAYATKQ